MARRAAGLVLLVGGAATLWLGRALGPNWLTAAGLAAAAGVLLLLSPRRGRLTESFRATLLFRAWFALCLTQVIGLVLWELIPRLPATLSWRNYTIWALLELAFLGVLVARIVDAVHRHSRFGLRLIFVLAILLLLGTGGPQGVGERGHAGAVDPAADTAWLDHLDRRLDELPPGPAIVVAASGGGSRAALFTALALDALARTPVHPEGGLAGTADHGPTFGDHVLLISSVSGGSLATAWFATRSPEPDREELRHTTERELTARIRDQARRYLESPVADDAIAGPFLRDLGRRLDTLDAGVQQGETLPALPVSFRSAFADDMSMDFMAPILRGVLLPGIDRGAALTCFWEDRFGWADLDNRSWPSAKKPLVVLNAAYAQRGRRLVIGFPPLGAGCGDLLTLSSLAPGYRLSLANAVRLSAGFPWLMPVARLDVPPPNPTTAPLDDEFHVVDGGVVDNTGMDTLAGLCRGLGELAGSTQDAALKARGVLDRLRRRGVILLEIDSGAKKRALGGASRALPSLLEPIEALQVALDANAKLSRSDGVGVVERMLPARRRPDALMGLARGADFDRSRSAYSGDSALVHLTLSCDRFDDVMTAWALAAEDKAVVWTTFLFEFGLALPTLRDAYWIDYEVSHSPAVVEGGPNPRTGVKAQVPVENELKRLRERVATGEAYRAALRRSLHDRGGR